VAESVQRASRILNMIPIVVSRPGIRIEELADIVGIPPKAVLRDLDAILMCGVPPYLPSDYVGVYVEDGGVFLSFAEHFRRPVTLTLQEALSIRLAMDAMQQLSGAAATGLRAKLESLLPEGLRGKVERQFHVSPQNEQLRERLALLREAIGANRKVAMAYYTASRDALSERTLQPFGLVELHGKWYVVGHCELRGRELPFRVDRIRRLRLLDDGFAIPRSFDIEKYRRPEMYFPSDRDVQVTVRVDAELAQRVREEMAFPEAEWLPDGDARFRFRASRPEWVVAWAIQYGPKLEILEPESLRRRMADTCARVLGLYAAD